MKVMNVTYSLSINLLPAAPVVIDILPVNQTKYYCMLSTINIRTLDPFISVFVVVVEQYDTCRDRKVVFYLFVLNQK